MSWIDQFFTQKLVISLILSQIVRFLDHFWLIERWQGMIRSWWEIYNNDIFTLILATKKPKTLFLRAVLSEIVTIPKGCRFQKRSKTTSRTIQRLPTIIIITSYDHHQGQKTQITLIFDFLQHSLDQYARYIHSGDSKIRIQVGHN